MINELIGKYKPMLETCKEHSDVGNNELIGHILETILGDLEELKQNINKLTEKKYDLCIDVINGEIIGGTDE